MGAFHFGSKFISEPIQTLVDDGLFEGYASLFHIADLNRDIVEAGAFTDSLYKRGARGIKMLWQHDPHQPIGRWLVVKEDARGLKVRGRLNLAVARAREVHALMRDGAIDGLSIGFRVEKAKSEPATRTRRLERLDLWEISLVTFPMLPQARVNMVKSHSRARLPEHPLLQAVQRCKTACLS
jgi:uncharacterized protein